MMTLLRLPDWENRLSLFLEDRMSSIRLVWGVSDCALFSADAVIAMTDHDYASAFRGRYSTATGSIRALRRYGGGTLKETLNTMMPGKPIGFAQRGDLVMHAGAVGVSMGAFGLFVGQEGEDEGLVRIARADWSDAWAVGA